MRRVIRLSILAVGVLAAVLALQVQSVQRLWFFTSDLVFVLLFPQLVYALYDPRANRTGSIVAFVGVAGVAAGGRRADPGACRQFIPYAELFAAVLPGRSRPGWTDAAARRDAVSGAHRGRRERG